MRFLVMNISKRIKELVINKFNSWKIKLFLNSPLPSKKYVYEIKILLKGKKIALINMQTKTL